MSCPPLLVRTPLGGFINHSDEPNCMRVQKDNRWNLLTIANILPGEELTLRYTMYKPRPIDLDDYGDHIKKVFKGES
jgi:SET domain-containing protein